MFGEVDAHSCVCIVLYFSCMYIFRIGHGVMMALCTAVFERVFGYLIW